MPPTFKQLLATDELIPIFAIGRVPHPVVIEIFGPGQTPLRAQARDPPAGKAEAA